ncbi:MAG: alpha/beta fold hydrolase, partial [Alphaproteobacteria bacterium]
RGHGPGLVLLHPVGLDASFWDDVAVLLSTTHRIIAVDLPGHGDSDVPAPSPGLADLARDVAELTEVIGLPPVTVIGCSLGGMVAQAMALDRPDHVAALVLANTSHDRDQASRNALHQRAARARPGMSAIIDETLERWFDEGFRSAYPERVSMMRAKLERADSVVHAWMWQAIADLDHGDRLRTVTQPSLVVSGTNDRSVPAAATAALAAVLPFATRAEVQGAGHLTPFERPQEFADIVRIFLAEKGKTTNNNREGQR